MNKRAYVLIAAALALGVAAAGGPALAGDTPDVIEMKNPAYEKHTKGIVQFTHKKHYTDYGAACGDCHHDDQGKPLTDLKEGDDVEACIDCHSKPSEKPKGKDAPKLSRAEELEYHAEAIHDNCKGCHRDYNRKNKTKAAPTTCSKCHPKE